MIRLPNFIKNNKKYTIILILFVVWILCFDEVRVPLWLKQRSINNNTEREIDNFKRKTLELEMQIEALKTSGDSVEKFAREHFYMKYDNEDIYIFN